MRAAVWRMEWRLALRRRRLLLMNVGIPLLLVIPLAFGGAPAFHAAAAYAVLFVLIGTFGSAIPLVRDADAGLLRRMVLGGVAPRAFLLQRTAAGAALDTVVLLPALVLILMAGRSSGGLPQGMGVGVPGGTADTIWWLALPVLFGSLLAANLIGAWVAMLARSLAEGALFAAVVSLFLLHGSGVFRTATPGSLAAAVEPLLPFGPLHDLLLAGAGGGTLGTSVTGSLFPAWGGTALILALSVLFGRTIVERIALDVR